jgi:xanthine dehydrogenase molybdopterin-binding subunit B
LQVLYIGQPIGAILAETHRKAVLAAQAVVVEYDVMDHVITIQV